MRFLQKTSLNGFLEKCQFSILLVKVFLGKMFENFSAHRRNGYLVGQYKELFLIACYLVHSKHSIMKARTVFECIRTLTSVTGVIIAIIVVFMVYDGMESFIPSTPGTTPTEVNGIKEAPGVKVPDPVANYRTALRKEVTSNLANWTNSELLDDINKKFGLD